MDEKVSVFISWQLNRIAADLKAFKAAYKAAKCDNNLDAMVFYRKRMRDWKAMALVLVG